MWLNCDLLWRNKNKRRKSSGGVMVYNNMVRSPRRARCDDQFPVYRLPTDRACSRSQHQRLAMLFMLFVVGLHLQEWGLSIAQFGDIKWMTEEAGCFRGFFVNIDWASWGIYNNMVRSPRRARCDDQFPVYRLPTDRACSRSQHQRLAMLFMLFVVGLHLQEWGLSIAQFGDIKWMTEEAGCFRSFFVNIDWASWGIFVLSYSASPCAIWGAVAAEFQTEIQCGVHLHSQIRLNVCGQFFDST